MNEMLIYFNKNVLIFYINIFCKDAVLVAFCIIINSIFRLIQNIIIIIYKIYFMLIEDFLYILNIINEYLYIIKILYRAGYSLL